MAHPLTLKKLGVKQVEILDEMPRQRPYNHRNQERWEYAKEHAGNVVAFHLGEGTSKATPGAAVRKLKEYAASDGVEAEITYSKTTVYVRVAASEGVGR
jgi:hypothetical protein